MSPSKTGDYEAAPPEFATGLAQDYAISPKGWAMPIPNGVDGNRVTVLLASNASSFSSSPWERAAKEMLAKGEQPWRTSFSLTPEESQKTVGVKTRRYILVGFALTGLAPEHYKVAPSMNPRNPDHNATDGTGLWLGPASLIPNVESRNIVMVVMAGWNHELDRNEHLHFRALLRPDLGICHPYSVQQEECFYLPIFRRQDNGLVKSAVGRRDSWNHRVREAMDLRPPTQAQHLPNATEAAKDTSQETPQEPKKSEPGGESALAAGYDTYDWLQDLNEPEGFV